MRAFEPTIKVDPPMGVSAVYRDHGDEGIAIHLSITDGSGYRPHMHLFGDRAWLAALGRAIVEATELVPAVDHEKVVLRVRLPGDDDVTGEDT